MTDLPEGTFRLYSHIDPPLAAGSYRFRATQTVSASGTAADQLPVEPLDTMVDVRSPRYQLPPDQVLSVFPPANTEGSFGLRLPQVVIRRRTLPWERDLPGQPSTTPWLALVVIAEGEGVLHANQPVAACVTPGTTLPGTPDVPLGAYLEVTRSVVDDVFPTRKDVPLLAHARAVDLRDTELMMGDDDGYLAVVIANRLPLAGRAADGSEAPVRYLACLVSLEGQFDVLAPQAPPRVLRTIRPELATSVTLDAAGWDKVRSGLTPTAATGAIVGLPPAAGPAPAAAPAATGPSSFTLAPHLAAGVHEPTRAWSLEDAVAGGQNVYQQMAEPFALHDVLATVGLAERRYRFPVLLHWSFTTTGENTFETLMKRLDSGMLGTTRGEVPHPQSRPAAPPRQPELEVVETGHVGLPHRTRTGETVRCWYRGPFVPHPTTDRDRLALAHAADQLRVVVPDGREDLSLAAAFEIGRLLALSRPSSVAALLRWRRTQYQVVRHRTILDANGHLLADLLADDLQLARDLPVLLGRHLAAQVVSHPDAVLGPPRALVDPGRPLGVDAAAVDLVAEGFGLDARLLVAQPRRLADLSAATVPTAPLSAVLEGLRAVATPLQVDLAAGLADLVSGTLAPELFDVAVAGPTVPRHVRRPERVPDRLDAMLVEQPDDEEAAP
jgi:hypothetical protein